MTDVTTEREPAGDPTGGIVLPAVPSHTPEPQYAWGPPAEPPRRPWRLALWIGIPVGLALIAAAAASTILLAPGLKIAGVDVGGMTPGAAADAVQRHLDETSVEIAGITLTGAELGATVDARHLTNEAYAASPMWNLGAWFGDPIPATVTVDEAAATAALRAELPGSYIDPVDAVVSFDEATLAYRVTPGEIGEGIDVAAVRDTLQGAFDSATATGQMPATSADIVPLTTTAAAEERAEQLNTMIAEAGYYVGDERAVPLDPARVASWLTLETDDDGVIQIVADEAAIAKTVKGLAKRVDRAVVNATVITNPAGDVLRAETAGQTGRTLESTSGIPAEYADLLASGDAKFPLEVTEVAFETTSLARNIEVNLSSQRAFLFENGEVVNSWYISSGLPGTPTPTGNFSVFAHVSMQDMGCFEGAVYCTEDVPWVTYFAPDVGFHGAYWHSNWGSQMSHGCVNMPVDVAKYVYDWAPVGTPVWVHY